MTKQEIFDKVYAHAQEMTAPAIDKEGFCKYRSPNGPCLIGILVSDEEASATDKLGWSVAEAIRNKTFVDLNPAYSDFYCGIQNCHDNATSFETMTLDKEIMLDSLKRVANQYGLEIR